MGPGDFYDLVKDYARQELVDPLRPIPRWLGFGVIGSLFLMVGGISLILATLRVLQEETGTTFTGNLSWVPYSITAVGSTAVWLCLRRIRKRTVL